MKSHLKTAMGVIFIFILLESIARFLLVDNYYKPVVRIPSEKSFDYKSEYKYFCDMYHKNQLGQELVNACWKKSISAQFKLSSVWVLGGSTASEKECDVKTSWVQQSIQAKALEFKNFSKSGMNSDILVQELEKNLKMSAPEVIVLSLIGVPEIELYGDQRDLNYEKLKSLNDTFKNINSLQRSLFLFASSVDITLKYNSAFYRYLEKHSLKSKKDEILEFSEFFHINSENSKESPNDWDQAMTFRNISPLRYYINAESLMYALENYKINFEKLKTISKNKNIKFICVLQPYAEDAFKSTFPNLNKDIRRWFDSFYNLSKELCTQNNFLIVDVKSCF